MAAICLQLRGRPVETICIAATAMSAAVRVQVIHISPQSLLPPVSGSQRLTPDDLASAGHCTLDFQLQAIRACRQGSLPNGCPMAPQVRTAGDVITGVYVIGVPPR